MVRMGGTGARCPSYRATILTIGEHPRRLSRKNELRALGRTGLPEGDAQERSVGRTEQKLRFEKENA